MKSFKNNLLPIISFLVLFLIIINLGIVIGDNNNLSSNEETIMKDKGGVEYTVVDRYASGEEVVRETRNSLDYSPSTRMSLDEDDQPLSKYKTSLLGSEEMSIIRRNPTNSFMGASTIGRYSDHRNLDFDSPTAVSFLDLAKGGSVVGPVIQGQQATGDVDGNFREDVVFAGILNGELNIKIGENWGDYGFGIRANTAATHLWPTTNVLTVMTGDYDGDNIAEFAVLGLNGATPTIWIFEDLVNSTPQPQTLIHYGDTVLFRSVNGADRYVYSPGVTFGVLDGKDVSETLAANEKTIQFTIEDPDDRNSTALVQFGDDILLKDYIGNYWTDWDDTGFAVTGPLPQLIGQPPHVADQQRWIIHSDRSGSPTVGAVYNNQYLSFQNYVSGNYIRALAQYEMKADSTTASDWFRLLKNDTLPRTFTNIPLQPIQTLTHTNFQKLDILPSVSEYDIGKLINTKGMVTGNFDDDLAEELAVIGMDASGWARAWIYDDALNNYELLHEISWQDDIQNIHPNVVVSNLDDDIQDEIIFSLTKSSFGKIEVYDDGNAGFALVKEITSVGSNLHGDLTNLAAGDIDSDGYEDIVFVNGNTEIFVWADTTGNFALKYNFNAGTSLIPYYTRTTGLSAVNYYLPLDLAVGDIDIDGNEEIILSSMISTTLIYYEGSGGLLSIWDHNGTDFVNALCEGPIHSTYNTNNVGDREHGQFMKVDTGDFSADHFTVKYLEHQAYTSNEQIIAVLAAPPTQKGISQNYDDSGTSYGEGESSSSGQSWGASASFGAYMSLEVEVTAGFLVSMRISKVEAEFALIAETAATYTVTSTTAYVSTFSTDASSDYVVFSTCLYDLFIYEILDAPDPLLIGENYSIHIPVDPTVEKWDVDFYNEHNSESAHDIGRETFNHTIGYITSYPTKEEMEKIAPNETRMETDKISVGKGGATIGQEIDLSTETEISLETSLTFEWKVGAGAGVVTAGIQGSLGLMGGHSWGWGEDTMFACEIGDIQEDEDYINFHYQCGMFVYVENYVPKPTKNFLSGLSEELATLFEQATTLGLDSFERGEGYYVLNYWVEVPLGWGDGAADARDYGDDVDDVVEEYIESGLLPSVIFYPAIAALPVANLFLRRRGGKK